MADGKKEKSDTKVKSYYQGIYMTETIMGNPNGDFIDNSPRNFDGRVFTTDKCIKYNVRKYLHDNYEKIKSEKEEIKEIKDFIFFYPRKSEDAETHQPKYQKKDTIFGKYFFDLFNESAFKKLIEKSPDVRMFGGTFSFDEDKFKDYGGQIYGPIQISYGLDINDAQIKRLQIGAPFSSTGDSQKTTGSEAIVDDAIIAYDLTINPNNHPELLKEKDLELFKEAIWYGTNLRKSTSKKTDSKLLFLIKYKNENNEEKTPVLNIGELKQIVRISNKDERKRSKDPERKIKIDFQEVDKLLSKYNNYIEKIEVYSNNDEVEIINLNVDSGDDEKEMVKVNYNSPETLLDKNRVNTK